MAAPSVDSTGSSSNRYSVLPAASQIVSINRSKHEGAVLKCSGRASTTVTNQWVTLPSGSSSYGLASAQSAATKFFIQKYNTTNTWAFHNADDTRQLALRGQNGTLLYLVDVTNPRADNIPGGQLMEWATFTMDNNVLGVNDGSTLKSRTFAAVPSTGSTYTLALYDGKSTF
jgi:hypothetical protein